MSRLFDDAASEYLYISPAVLTAIPITMACWFNSDTITKNQALIYCSSEDDDNWHNFGLQAGGAVGGDPVRASAWGVGGDGTASTTSGYSADTWHHGCAVFETITARAIYIDGGSKGTNAVHVVPGTLDNTTIGAAYVWSGAANIVDGALSGLCAEPAIWSCALTDLEAWLLSRGVPPPLIRPQSLAAYWPLWDTDRDVWNARYHMTPFNTPTWANHPPKVLDWWRKYGNRAQTQFALKQFISRQPYNLSYHKPQAFVPTGVTRIPRHPAQYNTLAIY